MASFSSIIPRRFISIRGGAQAAGDSPLLLAAARVDGAEALSSLHSDRAGLSHEEAERRLAEHGSNSLAQDEGETRLSLLGRAFLNPLVILLAVLATVSFATGDVRAAARDGRHGGPRRLAALRPGGPGRHGRQEAEGDDQRHRHRPPRRRSRRRCRWPSWCPATS